MKLIVATCHFSQRNELVIDLLTRPKSRNFWEEKEYDQE